MRISLFSFSRRGCRYLLSSEKAVSDLDMAEMLRGDKDIAARVALPTQADGATTYRPLYSPAKARAGLGVRLRPVEESVRDAARDMLDRGLVAAA
jgi:hypothetical protein